jgi:hypothetical protein
LLFEESEGVVVCGELSVAGGQSSSPSPAPAPVVFVQSVVSLELVLPVDVAPLSVVSEGVVGASARRIVPELCELPVSAVSESVSERML